ncbi:hypothetical protein KR074_009772, partial [Drosophila pseudoananassae]
GLGRTPLLEHSIDVGDAKPVKQRHWPISPAKEEIMFKEVENMLALGIIEESKSPWSSNCVLVRKGPKVRLCLDSREVNNLTIKDAYPLPHNEDGVELPIAYMSEKLSKAQRNYSVTEIECLAVIKGIEKFRAYIEGQDFQVVTDHATLQWLLKQKDLRGRLERWAMKLRGLKLKIEHRKGSQNIVADALSRREEGTIDEIMDSGPIIDLDSKEFNSAQYNELREQIRANQDRLPDFKIVDQFVYKKT